jgi:hypothetical protein
MKQPSSQSTTNKQPLVCWFSTLRNNGWTGLILVVIAEQNYLENTDGDGWVSGRNMRLHEFVNCCSWVQARDQCPDFVNTAMNLRVPQKRKISWLLKEVMGLSTIHKLAGIYRSTTVVTENGLPRLAKLQTDRQAGRDNWNMRRAEWDYKRTLYILYS